MKPKLLDKVDKKLFTLDESMTNVMSLPPKPEKFSSGILPKKNNNNKSKSGDNSKDYLTNARKRNNEEEELGFLADIIGVNQLSKEFFSNSNRANNNFSNDNNNQSSKPLTQVLSQAVLEGASVTMEKLKTVEDAASYFARYGSETPIKFVRLITVNDGLNFTPYDLITTDMYDPNIEHYTMSPAGMVYMSPTEQSDCVPLSLWMRQKFNFNILRKIPFFKHYLNRKAFTIWFENVKYQLFMKQRKKVIDKLFLARKTCCPAVLSTRNHLLSIKQVKLLNYDLKTCDKDVFIDQQLSQLSQASIQFEETMRRVTSEVQSVIIEVNNIYSLAYQDTSNNMLLFNDSSKPEKAKSLVKLKQEKADRKLMRQKAKLEFSTLCDYIRYMDYLCLECFFDYTINSIKLFYDEFNKPRKQGLFETMVRFANNGTVFNPTSEDIHDMMVKLFENVISTVGNMNRVGYITVKGINLNPIISANISTIIKENIQYNQTIENIKARIVSDYERAEEHSTTYEQVRPIYDFNMSWNFDEYKSKQHDILSLKKMMELITGWSKELDKLRNKPIGILDVDSRKLKAELYPMREARLSEIKEYIKDIARVKCMQLLDHYKDCISKINPRPNVLKDFAKQVQTVNAIKDDEKNLFIQTSQVDQMYNLLQLYEVTIPNEDVVLHEELYNKQQEYKRDIENVFIFREQKLNEMINNVNVCITKLHEQILAFLDKLDDPNFTRTQLIDEPDWVLDDLSLLVEKFESLNVLAKLYSSYQKLFNVPVTEYAELEAGTKKVNITQKLWETVRDWGEDHTSWMEDEFTKLNVQKINKKVITYYNEAVSLHKELGNAISEKLKDRVSEFKDMMPSVLDLGNKNMKPRHFEKLFGLINQVYYPTMSYTLYQLIKGGIMKFKDVIHEISTYATGEALLEKTLSEIKDKWDKTKFIVKNHRDQHGLYILGSLDDILNQIEEHQIILQNTLHSPYIKDISDRIYGWIQKLNSLSDTIDEWTVCQKLYIYIENIFINEDIQKQLPNESQKFLTIDRSWKTIMLKTYNDTLVTSCLNPMEPNTSNGGLNLLIIEQLRINNELLQTIEKSLDDYLDTKRILFPRFSYLSNNELVEVLSLSKDSHMIQRYLTKCFDSIVKLKFGDSKKTYDVISGFYDACDEYIEFNEVIKADSQVEIWLIQLEKAMKNILYEKLKLSFHTYPSININLLKSLDSTSNDNKLSTNTPRIEWLLNYPSQVILSIDQVIYTNQCITYINKYIDIFNPNNQALKELLDITIYEIDLFIEIIKSSSLSTNQVIKMNTLLILYIHNRDNVKSLISNSISSLNDYIWIKSLRYYWEKSLYSEDLLIKQIDNSFDYGYEYIGCSGRLVITPLTDVCYLTLTTALSMQLGGSVSGPAGSGKTETIKDLSKTFANFCLVFNCSESVDYKVTNRLFSGLAQQGSWICFDEFNRLDRQVISVIAAQILSIQQAIRNKVNEFSFNGKTIPINHNFGVFITTNPDYAKRIDLPDNLKSLFRPVVMMIPDYRLIAEVLLYTFGYTNASILSQKLLTLFKLSSELLSKQLHYDFGMRSMKTILNIISNNNKLSKNNDESIIINAIRDVILPRLVDPDTPVFNTIMNDIFPGNKLDSKSNDVRKSIDNILDKYKLQKPTNYTNKIIQIHDTLEIRNACIMIGETASGKSTALKVLGDVKSDIDNTLKVDKYVINPTAISIDELYGLFNRQTNEWRDGILSKLVRDCVDSFNEQKSNLKWIIFDGPIDSDWIENMNSVMDDNKLLCLSNSERIKIPSTISILFEVQDIAFATPATISRCGIVYFEQVHIGILSIIRTWGSTSLTDLADSQQAKLILSTIEANLQVAITYVRNECVEKFPSTNNHLSIIFLNLFTAQLRNYEDTKSLVHDNDIINALVVWCIIWSVGANIHDDSKVKFIEWCRVRFSTTIPSKYSLILSDPYGIYIDLANKDIKPWVTLMKSDNLVTNNKNESNIYVNTIETTKYIYLFDNLLLNNHNILLCGDMCIGKSMLIKSYLSSIDKSKGYSYVYNYSINTNPVDLSNVFEKQLEKKRKTLLAPYGNNSKFYLFIDDINISSLNSTNVQPVNELLRNVIDVGGYYDQTKLFFKNVNDTVIIGACSTTGGRNNSLNPRLLSKFHMIWMSSLSSQSLNTIYTSKLNSYIYNNLPNMIQLSNQLVTSSIEMLSQLKSAFLPTPKQSHYIFTLNDLSNVFNNITSTNSSFVHDEIGFIRLWIHEYTRIFRDRLINESDRVQFDNLLLKQVNQLSTDSGVSNPWNKDNISSIVYNCYIYNDKSYRYIQSSINQSDTLLDLLNEYHTQSNDRLDIVFFPQAINHINRLTRLIAKPYNHALLLGSYGTGRKSLTRLSTYLCDHRLYTISLSTTYSIIDWKENIKELISSTCISSTPTVFMISDNDIIDELFLEDINAIICNNQIINIFTDNELETILNQLRPVYRQTIKPDNKIDSKLDIKASKNDNKTEVKIESRETILSYFTQQLEKLLKVVICLTPDNNKYRERCQRYPTIFTHCTIDFYDEWSDESMSAIAYNNLSIANLSYNLNIESYINTIVNISILLYKVVKLEAINYNKQTTNHIYLTTNHFLEYLNTYITLYFKQSNELFKLINKYTNGLNIISGTDKLIKSLDKSMKELKPKLETNIIDSNELMNQLKKQEIIIQEQKVLLNKSIDELTNLSNDCMKMKQECQNELDVIIPTYDNAMKALNTLDKKSIQELKGFSNPPDLVKYTLETICILFNKPIDWNESKILLNQIDFIDKCKNYDKNNINSKIIRKLDKYINDSKFIPEEVKKQSVAAMCLCMWVKALYTYSVTLKSIEPKQINISNIEKNIEIINNEKLDNEMKLNDKVNYLNQLNDQINNIQTNQINNEKLINDINKKLKVSNELINLLNYEKTNWLHNVNQYNNEYNILYISMCISSSFLTYLSNFNSLYRNNIINQFYNVMKANSIDISSYNLIESLVNKETINQWEINQLPKDNFSIENGIYITSKFLSRFPIIIDPNSLAQSFIKHTYKQLYTIKCINNKLPNDYVNTLENCIKNGYVCVIEDYYITNHQIDKYINIIIKQRINNRSNSNILTIRWNDRDLNYHNDFKLFIINKYNHMNYSIDIYNDFYMINYCANSDSLEQQLLVEIISHEKPELQDKLNQLKISLANDQKELTTVENDILNLLSNSTAEEIVSNDELIVVLGRSKNLHVSLSKRIEEAETTSKEIRDTKEGYRMLAKRGAILFNVISSLSSINPMYTYSHQYLITLFNSKLMSKSDNKNIALRQRINTLLNEITKTFYLTISYSLLEKDRLLYAFLLSIYINISNNNITLKEWDIYINGINFDNKILEKRPYPNSFHKSKYLMTSNNSSGTNTPNTGSPIASPTNRSNVKLEFNTSNKTNRTTFSNVSSTVSSPKAINSSEDKFSNAVSPLKSSSNNSALQSPKGLNTTNVVPKDTPTVYINTIITKKIWQTIVMLESTLPVFDGLCADIMSKTTAWIDFLVNYNNYDELDKEKDKAINKAIDLKPIDKDLDKQSEKKKDKQIEQEKENKIVNSTNYNIPNIWETKLSEYQKLLLIRLISKERQINSINKYICNHLGNYYNDNNLINLSDIYSTTSNFIPIMYVMTVGNNPIDKVIQLARSKDIKIDIISLGQGQETIAEKALVTAINQGSWLCFENCHLASNYMITLNSFIDKHIVNHKNEKIHKDFRLWLITLSTTNIPLYLVTNCIKLMNDTSDNLKSNVIRSLYDNKLNINVNNINSNNENFKQYTLIYKKIIYSTVLLHNFLNERSKYQSIGFNNNYNWLNNDCKYSISLMNRFINDNYVSISSIDQTSSIPWQLIQQSTNTLVYNGRVTDSWDERVINSYIKKFFNDDIMNDTYNYGVNGFTSLPGNIELDVSHK